MMVTTLAEAETEFESTIAYYESPEPSLGKQFRDEVASAVEWISANPKICV